MNELKVDNSHFRKVFFQIDCILAIFLLMMETVYFLIWWRMLCDDFSVVPQRLLIYLVLPSILNLLILFGVVLIQKYAVNKETLQNYAVIVALVMMVFITVFLYQKFPCVMCLFVLPIFMTTAFRDRKMTHRITASAVAGCLVYAALSYLTTKGGAEKPELFPNVAIALVIMILSDMLVMMLLEIMVLLFVSDIQKIADTLEQDMAKAVQDVMGTGNDRTAEGGQPEESEGIKTDEEIVEKPDEIEKSAADEKPEIVEEPVADEKPEIVEEPVADEKPDAVEESAADGESEAAAAPEDEEVELSPDEKKLRQLIVQIPQIDSKKGIAYCANDEHLYLEILKDFATNSALRQLTELQEKGSWGNYQIGVRVLKNTSESLGFPELSRHTGELDQAAQREDYDYIRVHHGEIIAEYLQIAEKIMSIVK